MHIWTEFKTVVFPWLLAAIVVGVFLYDKYETLALVTGANTTLANAVERQGEALSGINTLLASQGFTSVPLAGERESE